MIEVLFFSIKPREEPPGWGSARGFKYKKREAGDRRKGVGFAGGRVDDKGQGGNRSSKWDGRTVEK